MEAAPSAPSLPDLVLASIVLRERPARATPDEIVVNAVVKNEGADSQQGFVVACTYSCDDGPTTFWMKARSGLNGHQSVTLGGNSHVSLSRCSFQDQRRFTCNVQGDGVTELDASNNSRSEVLFTGR